MRIVAPLLSMLLMCSAEAAHAATIAFEVEYTTLFSQTCVSHAGCFTLPNTPFTRTFTLDSSEMAIDGVYDVTGSLDPSPIFTPAPDATFTISLVADAVVSGEHVIDLVIDFLETTERDVVNGQIETSSSFDASSGIWSRATSTSDPFGLGGSSRANGTYIVQQVQQVPVPEPSTLLLMLGGGAVSCVRARRRGR